MGGYLRVEPRDFLLSCSAACSSPLRKPGRHFGGRQFCWCSGASDPLPTLRTDPILPPAGSGRTCEPACAGRDHRVRAATGSGWNLSLLAGQSATVSQVPRAVSLSARAFATRFGVPYSVSASAFPTCVTEPADPAIAERGVVPRFSGGQCRDVLKFPVHVPPERRGRSNRGAASAGWDQPGLRVTISLVSRFSKSDRRSVRRTTQKPSRGRTKRIGWPGWRSCPNGPRP